GRRTFVLGGTHCAIFVNHIKRLGLSRVLIHVRRHVVGRKCGGWSRYRGIALRDRRLLDKSRFYVPGWRGIDGLLGECQGRQGNGGKRKEQGHAGGWGARADAIVEYHGKSPFQKMAGSKARPEGGSEAD